MGWWLPKQKQYLPTTKRWYCHREGKRTLIERNPLWDGSFKGNGTAPEWFTRCAVCKEKHWQNSGYDCPNCGCYDLDETTLISQTEPVYNRGMAMEYGGTPTDWIETHRCPKCRHVFEFTNSNY